MGKNTMMKCMHAIRIHSENTGNKAFLNLIPLLVVGAPACVGLVAPIDVVVPPGNTGLDSSQTSFFQVFNIPTKINKGTVQIITHAELIKKGDKVGSSEDALFFKLGIRPFCYGLVVVSVYDNGSVFSPKDPSKFAVAAVAAPARLLLILALLQKLPPRRRKRRKNPQKNLMTTWASVWILWILV
ncbi:60S acidic ribosomal protein P0 [Glycine soja]